MKTHWWIIVLLMTTCLARAENSNQPQSEPTLTCDEKFADCNLDSPRIDVPVIQIFWENDGTFFKPNHKTDRHYTNGVAIGAAGKPAFASDLADWMPFHEQFAAQAAQRGGAVYGVGGIIGQLMFTPTDIQAVNLIADDWPYGGYLFGSVYFQRADSFTLDHFRAEIGLTGRASLAEDAQEAVHELRNIDEARGWQNQSANEFEVQFYLRKKWKLIDTLQAPDGTIRHSPQGLNFQAIPAVGVALGTTYRNLEGGVLVRLGFNLPDDFGPARLADLATMTGKRKVCGLGAYAFARVSGKYVEHDIFLEGANWTHSHGVDLINATGEVQGGIAVQYHWNQAVIEATYSQTYMSKQFHGQHGTDSIGAAMLTMSWPF